MATENKRFKIRRDTAANWTAINPILSAGEEGYETDTRKSKVGDGSTNWVGLLYKEGGTGGNSFGRISVSGQSDVVADQATDTLTLVAGSNVTITTNASGDTVTFNSTGGGAVAAGALTLKTDLDCSTNPNYPPAVKGDAYVVTVAGRVGGGSGVQVDVGDLVICKTDNAGGSQAAVGTSWFALERNLVGLLLASNNLADLANAATARANLQLAAARTRLITFNWDGGTSTPSTGLTGEFSVPVAGTIVGAKLLLDAAGSAVIDIRKVAFGGEAPVTSICASAKPTLSSARRIEAPLTGWTTAIAADEVFVANLESASGFTKATLQIEYEAN